MTTYSVTLRETFLKHLEYELPEPLTGTKTEKAYELNEAQAAELRGAVEGLLARTVPDDADRATKLALANLRRSAEGASRLLDYAGFPTMADIEAGKAPPPPDKEEAVARVDAVLHSARKKKAKPAAPKLVTLGPDGKPKRVDTSKTKFTCPSCDARVWGCLATKVICAACDEPMTHEGMDQ